jgi:hypothetical protein
MKLSNPLRRHCRKCAHSAATGPTTFDGVCRFEPPKLTVQPNGDRSGDYPPVNLDLFVCGRFQRKRWVQALQSALLILLVVAVVWLARRYL